MPITPLLEGSLKRLLPGQVAEFVAHPRRNLLLFSYRRGGRIPWTAGYDVYKTQFLTRVLHDEMLCSCFAKGRSLPEGYGIGVDERCVEYPWLLSRLPSGPGRLLDAGSTLNYDFVLEHPALGQKKLHIVTLAPERYNYWSRGISYFYEDLRDIPTRDDYYDAVVCLSTLEHVGFDNTLYTGRATGNEVALEERPRDFLRVMDELRRVLKRGGKAFITVPFGKYQRLGWFQQFDLPTLSAALGAFGRTAAMRSTFYRYTEAGWVVATAESCAECEYVGWASDAQRYRKHAEAHPAAPDRAAAARAVACLELWKG